jgi:hypothetical protein
MITKAHHPTSLTEEHDAQKQARRHRGTKARRHERSVGEGRKEPSATSAFALFPPRLVPTPCLRAFVPTCLLLHPLPPSSSVPNFQTNPPRCANSAHLPKPRAPRRTIDARRRRTNPPHTRPREFCRTNPRPLFMFRVSCLHVSRLPPPLPPATNRHNLPKPATTSQIDKTKPLAILAVKITALPQCSTQHSGLIFMFHVFMFHASPLAP